MFAGSPYETRRCPRLAADKAVGLVHVARLYHATEGRLGAAISTMPAPLVDALLLYRQGDVYERANRQQQESAP